MNRVAPLALTLALAAPAARADVTISAHTDSEGIPFLGQMSSTETTSIAGDKQAVETVSKIDNAALAQFGAGKHTSLQITRLDRELQWVVNQEERTYSELRFSDLKKMMTMFTRGLNDAADEADSVGGESLLSDTEVPDVDVRQTGQRKVIAGVQTEQVILTVGGTVESDNGSSTAGRWSMDLWLARGVPELSEAERFSKRLSTALGADPEETAQLAALFHNFGEGLERLSEKMRDVEGYPLESTLSIETHADEADGGRLVISFHNVVDSIDPSPIPASQFEVPSGFTKQDPPLPFEREE